jgi:cyanate lyase
MSPHHETAYGAARQETVRPLLDAMREKGLSFAKLADAIGADRLWTAAAVLGQHPLSSDQAGKVLEVLDLPEELGPVLTESPMRGSFHELPPSDPTIYRLYEVLQVYGPALKALIHEDFGDGIMSAINFRAGVERVEHEEGARVRITLEGKFLPYAW